MKKSTLNGVLAAIALSVSLVSAAHAAPGTLDSNGFAPSSEPNVAPGYNPTLQPSLPSDGSNVSGGTGGNNYAVTGAKGEADGMHNNGATTQNTEYDFERQYRFTGDNQLGTTQKTRQNALQGMGLPLAETGLLASPATKNFHGGSTFGFNGAAGGVYHSLDNKSGFDYLPGTGTGQLDVNITDGY